MFQSSCFHPPAPSASSKFNDSLPASPMPTLHPLLPNAPMLADPSILSPPLDLPAASTHVRRSPIPPSSRPKPPAPPGPPPPGRASAKRPSWNIPANLFRMDSNSNEVSFVSTRRFFSVVSFRASSHSFRFWSTTDRGGCGCEGGGRVFPGRPGGCGGGGDSIRRVSGRRRR